MPAAKLTNPKERAKRLKKAGYLNAPESSLRRPGDLAKPLATDYLIERIVIPGRTRRPEPGEEE